MADKASPTYFRKRGIASLDKKPARIETGVSQLRGLLWNVAEQREMIAFLDDGEMGKMRWVAECFEKWTWLKTAMGYQYGRFDGDSEWTHPIDALRYALHPFIETSEVTVSSRQPKTEAQVIAERAQSASAAPATVPQSFADQQAENIKQLAQQHFAEQFGLSNVFAEQERMRREAAEAENPKPEEKLKPPKTGLKFRF